MYTQEQIERAVETIGERIDASTCFMNPDDKKKVLTLVKEQIDDELNRLALVESTQGATLRPY